MAFHQFLKTLHSGWQHIRDICVTFFFVHSFVAISPPPIPESNDRWVGQQEYRFTVGHLLYFRNPMQFKRGTTCACTIKTNQMDQTIL